MTWTNMNKCLCAMLFTLGLAEPLGSQAAPSLIVLITVDQLRPDYLEAFAPQLRGGLARLTRGGAWFTNAYHDHAITETAPGHATLLAGRFPRSTGIMANRIGVVDDSAPLLGAVSNAALGASPRRFRGTTLVDWLRAKDSKARSLSVSMKDRGAILPVGSARTDVYWYDPSGVFTTSTYYRASLPEWVNRFNSRKLPQSFAGKAWTLLLADTAYKEPDSVSIERAGRDFVFPHLLPRDSAGAADWVRLTPWIDGTTLALALEGVSALGLGDGKRTDLLAVSLSATDLIGHAYGPDSREMHDNVLRLDQSLGVFLDSLFRLRDSSRVAVVLTSDHGIGTIPELAARTVTPMPVRVDGNELAAMLNAIVSAKGIDTNSVQLDQQIVLADRNALKAQRPALDSALDQFARQVRSLTGIGRVDHFRDLLSGDTVSDPIARRWVHQLPAASNVEMVITLTPYSTFGGNVASHGSPYDYDAHVPIIFYGAWFSHRRCTQFARTVDIAPTLAEVARVEPSEKLDGRALGCALNAIRP
ncbi:MAG TPA: alkaline phosphatase family protein [Gemmatimonadaceae bacterium]|nr:alkaline phosphatase family protein [Gemmatimonadaceae bacterium]